MNKKEYLTLGVTIFLFIIIIIVILIQGNKNDWKKEILKSEEYQIAMTDCNDRTTSFPKETVSELFNKWTDLSDNGPWTGNNNECHPRVTITYTSKGIVKEKEILLVDDSSLVINTNDGYWYYTNSAKVNNYLNSLFNKY